MTTTGSGSRDDSPTRTAVALAGATLLVWIVLIAIDHDGAGWFALPLLGLATCVGAWRAGATRRNTRALVALIVGALAVLVFLGFVIADA